jgi:hypothetical protein
MPSPEPAPHLDPLTRLAIRYGTDKFGGHLYTPSYHKLLSHLRDRPLRVLEIGVGGYEDPNCGGASLRMWAEYFPMAQITGLDYFEKNLDVPPRVRVVRGSQDDVAGLAMLNETHGPFDLIIDDGSHRPEHMIISFSQLYPRMPADGIYLIEDTQTCFMEHMGGTPTGQGTIYLLAYLLVLQMHRDEGYVPGHDEVDLSGLAAITESVSYLRNIICFKRGDNTYPSNTRLALEMPAVDRIFKAIEREATLNPAPRNVLSRIDMQNWAKAFGPAAALAETAMREFPNDLSLMRELLFMMRRMKEAGMVAALEARVAALEAFNGMIR